MGCDAFFLTLAFSFQNSAFFCRRPASCAPLRESVFNPAQGLKVFRAK